MEYFQILSSCNSDIGNCCSNPGVAYLLDNLRSIFNLIQLIVPILLIIFASVKFLSLVMNPEKKDGMKQVKNSFLAAVIVFFIPVLVDAVLTIMPETFSVTACWNQAKVTAEASRHLNFNYYSLKDVKKSSIIIDPNKYEQSNPEEESNNSSNSSSNISAGSAQGVIDGAKKVHTVYEQNSWAYYDSLSELRWSDINYSTNNPSKKTCCATFVGSALYIGGVFSESEINQYNYNHVDGISSLCSAHGWTKITDYSQLAAGDIVIMSEYGGSAPGHVQIYAGNGTWYNAGSTEAIQRENPYASDASGRFLYAYRKP